MKEKKDNAKARLLRDKMHRRVTYVGPNPYDIVDERAKLILPHRWYPRYAENKPDLRIYFRERGNKELKIAKVLPGPAEKYCAPAGFGAPRAKVGGVPIKANELNDIVKIETADKEEGGVLWICRELQEKEDGDLFPETL